MSEILQIEDLFVSYSDGTKALRGVRLAVQRGQRVGLIGPNGAGKTSLLLAIMRGVPFTGHVVVDGVELSRRTTDKVRSRCGMTFQDPDDQLFMPTLLDDVAFGPSIRAVPRRLWKPGLAKSSQLSDCRAWRIAAPIIFQADRSEMPPSRPSFRWK